MVRSNEEAVVAMMKQTRNDPGTCQRETRGWFDAPSAGDRDGDKDADANDGWASEPKWARVYGDRTPPKGAPLYFKNKSGRGFGHRCGTRNSVGGCRSTDMSNGVYRPGITGNATISQIEAQMGLEYVGWSRTISGIPIPGLEAPSKPKPTPKPPTNVTPPVNKNSIIFRIGTLNLQSLPPQKSLTKSLATLSGLQLWGMQEADLKRYKQELFKKWPHVVGIGTAARPANNTYSCPVGYAKGTFSLDRASAHKIYDGESGISLTRRLESAVFTHNSSKYKVAMVNLHSVLMKGSNQAKRKEMKAETKKVTFATVDRHLAKGLPVAVTADANDTANWFGTTYKGHKVRRVKNGIDQIVLIDGDHHKWDVLSERVIDNPGDHHTLRTKVSLTAK